MNSEHDSTSELLLSGSSPPAPPPPTPPLFLQLRFAAPIQNMPHAPLSRLARDAIWPAALEAAGYRSGCDRDAMLESRGGAREGRVAEWGFGQLEP